MTSSPRLPRPAGGRSPSHARLLVASVLALAVLVVFATPEAAQAGDKSSGRIDIDVALEPADAAPGSDATLVFTLKPLDKAAHELPGAHFIYAAGEKAIRYEAVEAAGVTYHLDKASRSDPQDVKDFEEVHKAWIEPFEIRVPVTLGEDLAEGTKLGLDFHYFGCLQGVACYGPVKSHVVTVTYGTAQGAGSTLDGSTGGAAVDPDVAAEPTGGTAGDEFSDGGSAEVMFDEAAGEVVVTFTPAFNHKMYGVGKDGNIAIGVKPVEADGVTWGKPTSDATPEFEIGAKIRIPVEREDDVRELQVLVTFQACDAMIGACKPPVQDQPVTIRWPDADEPTPEPIAPTAAPTPEDTGGLLFPVVEGDSLEGKVPPVEDESSLVQETVEKSPLLGMGLLFLIGLGLAFTPCVLPIIPITVSVITGGNADIPKKRLTSLLLMYVLGLSLAFASMGTFAAVAGGSLSAAFTMPAVQWGIALIFIALAFSMIGVYELQPPAWLMKLQGGAQKRSGSMIGAFLFGILGAIIASPCTAPAVAGLLIVTAKTGDVAIGFWLFFALGLGMGAVFFAAGALNFLMRPGPWMVYVRYTFGMLLFGAALYYLYSGGLISTTALWIMGLVIGGLAAYGVSWHLRTKEGEVPKTAHGRGLQVAVMWIAVTAFVAVIAAHESGDWIYVKDREHLAQLVEEANAEGKPAVVDFWAEWCFYCKEYDKLIEGDEELKKLFTRVKKIKVDLTDDAERWDIRHAVGLEAAAQPYMVFIDRKGRIRKGADVTQWYGDGEPGIEQLKARLAIVLGDAMPDETPDDTSDDTSDDEPPGKSAGGGKIEAGKLEAK